MFSYLSVVFRLKQNEFLQESIEISNLLSRRNCLIHQHSTESGESCGYRGVHFHGLFEYITNIGYDDRIFKQIKMCSSYFTIEDLNPFDYFLRVKKYSMSCVFIRICNPTYLHKHREKGEALQRVNTSLIAIDNIPKPCRFNLPKATHVSILDLCKAFSLTSVDDYLTPSDSTAFVRNWCFAQNIVLEEFVNDWIYCLNIEPQFKNTLYFQGVSDSCPKAILNSVIDACQPFVGEVSNGTTGYKFFWKGCLGKRMIALQEPHFDRLHSTDKMLEILEGTDSIIPVDDNTNVSMQRTPVVIIAKEFPDRKLWFDIKNRSVKCYVDLKSFQPPPKKLHPMWLCQMAEVHYVPWREKNTCNRSPAASNTVTNNSTVQLRTSAGANIVENAAVQLGTSAVVNIVENAAVQPGTSARENILENTAVEPGTSAVANILENTAVEPGTSAVANILENTAVQPGTSAGANIIENDTVQPGTSAGANILEEATVQPGTSAGAQFLDIYEEYRRISNSALESQKESDNASDWNCSELSEYNSESDFMDTEEITEKAPANLELNKPKLAVALFKEAKKSVQNARESEGGHKEKKIKKPFPNLGLFIKRVKRQDNDSPGTSSSKIKKGKQTNGVSCENQSAFPPVSGLFTNAPPPVSSYFGTALAFQSEEINSPGNSNSAVNKKKGNKGK